MARPPRHSKETTQASALSTALEAPKFQASEVPLLAVLFLAPLVAAQLPVNLLTPTARPTAGIALIWALCLSAAMFLSLIMRVVRNDVPLSKPPGWPLALAFPVWSALGLIWSANRGMTAIQTLLWAAAAVAWWLAADAAQRGAAGRVLASILAGALLLAGLTVREWLEHFRAGDQAWRAFVTFTNPNFLAGYLAPCLILVLGLAPRRPEAFKPSTWLATVGLLSLAFTAGLMVTGSRGGLLSAAAGVVVCLLLTALRDRGRAKEGWIAVATVVVVAMATGAALSGPIRAREQAPTLSAALPKDLCPHATAAGSTGESNRFRVLTWKGSMAMGKKRPLTGWGAGSFETAFSGNAVAGYTRHAHQGYLQLFAELGGPGLLLFGGLLLVTLLFVIRGLASSAAAWVPPAAGALAALCAHNLFDSVLYVPACGLLIFVLLGIAAGAGGLAVAENQPGFDATVRPRDGGTSGLGRTGVAVAAGIGLALCLSHSVGRSLLNEARAETARRPTTALEKLSTAEALLPWDYQVAQAQSVAYRYLGEWSKANTASQRAINLAPERPASYAAKADIAVYEGDLNRAILILQEGLTHSPQEVTLLYRVAQYQTQQTYSEQSLENYKKLAAVEDSDIGQVRALGEVLDYRFAKARIQIAIDAELKKDAKTAFEQRKKAACLLAQRRRFHDDNPVAYLAMGDWDAGVERELRGDEEALWKRLEKDYRQRGESHLAELCVAQAKAAQESRPRIEEIFKEQSS